MDVLYHEATFLDDNLELAKKTNHSTAKQAAQIAKDANVSRLILGHYSSTAIMIWPHFSPKLVKFLITLNLHTMVTLWSLMILYFHSKNH